MYRTCLEVVASCAGCIKERLICGYMSNPYIVPFHTDTISEAVGYITHGAANAASSAISGVEAAGANAVKYVAGGKTDKHKAAAAPQAAAADKTAAEKAAAEKAVADAAPAPAPAPAPA